MGSLRSASLGQGRVARHRGSEMKVASARELQGACGARSAKVKYRGYLALPGYPVENVGVPIDSIAHMQHAWR